ncbi:MAG: FAD-dependent oxidoreductase [Acetobacteraceae bacterium]|nr:FAD-dependent oxidoreductase [Acetobacteraceae bacterium]
MVEHVRVVVIGGGVVGCSSLYHLALRGWTDSLLLERDELTSGSTWHAAGNCPTFSTDWGVLKLQKYSADLYRRLGDAVDYPLTYHVTGSVRLSHTADRLDEYRYVRDMAAANGLEYEILSPAELKRRHPLVELDDLNGALWDPYDGDIDPSQLTQAFAKGARALGAKVWRFTKVTGLARLPGGEWEVTTPAGAIRAEVVVNAAGYRAGELMGMLGRPLPTATMSHQYLVLEDSPELLGRKDRVPLLRDPDVSYYLRQERAGFNLGPYEWQATPMWQDGLPEDFANQLWPDDLERLEPYIQAACARVPLLGTLGVRRVINGPIPYAPDGLPHLGPAHGLCKFFHANTFSFGIAQAGGAGKALAEWVVDGGPEWDLWSIDARRYTSYATKTFTTAKAIEVYQNEYAPAYPFEERPAGRPLRTSPLYERLRAKGAQFGARGGWERATWFARPGQEIPPSHSFRRRRAWFDLVGEEVRVVREAVGIIDLSGATRHVVSGPGAEAFLDGLCCSRLPEPGRIGPAYALDDGGRMLGAFEIARLSADRFYLISAPAAEWHDSDLLAAAMPADGSVHVEPVSGCSGMLALAGPRAGDVLSRVTRADLSDAAFPWLAAREIEIGPARPLISRTRHVGGLSWELHAPMEYLPALYEALWAAGEPHGIRDFGLYALDSLRLDGCHRGWKTELETLYSPLQASLDGSIDFDKPAFRGRAALLAERERGPSHRCVPLVLNEAGDADALRNASVFRGDGRVGRVTSGGWSYTLGRSVALAYVDAELAAIGTEVTVDVLGERRGGVVAAEPLFDPVRNRL